MASRTSAWTYITALTTSALCHFCLRAMAGMRTQSSFYGNYGEINSLAKYLKINILIVDEELTANPEHVGNWRWQPPIYPCPANHPHTGILRFTIDKKYGEGHYDVYAHDGRVLLDTANLPAVVKALHCIR